MHYRRTTTRDIAASIRYCHGRRLLTALIIDKMNACRNANKRARSPKRAEMPNRKDWPSHNEILSSHHGIMNFTKKAMTPKMHKAVVK